METLEIKLDNIDYETSNPFHARYNAEDNNRGKIILNNVLKICGADNPFSSSKELREAEFGASEKYSIERYAMTNALLIITKKTVNKPRFNGTIRGLHIIIGSSEDKISYYKKEFDNLVKSYDPENKKFNYKSNIIKS